MMAFLSLLVFGSLSWAVICPDLDELVQNKYWVEESARTVPAESLERHFKLPVREVALLDLPVAVEPGNGMGRFWIGVVVRSEATQNDCEDDTACYVLGSAAFYADEWTPDLDFKAGVAAGLEREWLDAGLLKLVELRWFNGAETRRYRWFSLPLAKDLGWLVDGSPIPLPWVVNSLF